MKLNILSPLKLSSGVLLSAALLVACGGDQQEAETPDGEGPMEEAGEWTDDAADDTEEAAEEAGEEFGDAGEEIGEGFDDAEDEIDDDAVDE